MRCSEGRTGARSLHTRHGHSSKYRARHKIIHFDDEGTAVIPIVVHSNKPGSVNSCMHSYFIVESTAAPPLEQQQRQRLLLLKVHLHTAAVDPY